MTNLGYNGYLMPCFCSLHVILKLLVYVRFAILKTLKVSDTLCLTLCEVYLLLGIILLLPFNQNKQMRGKKTLQILTKRFYKFKNSFYLDFSSYCY